MKLEYGMILERKARRSRNVMGFRYTSSNDQEYPCYYRVERYWENDTDPNQYKVRLKSCVTPDFADDSMYSSDLVSSIEKGHTIVKYIPSLFSEK